MLIDAHTHIFPNDFTVQRETLCRHDPTFAELYRDPKAKLATGSELSAAVTRNSFDFAVALGFAWQNLQLCREHNDALLMAAACDRRIIPLCTVNPGAPWPQVQAELERCAAAGARGVGELRPDSDGWDLNGLPGDRLASSAAELNLVLLFHASEPAGHRYPGKRGGEIGSLYRFVLAHPENRVVLAHWGGGLPFYALMPEVRAAFARTWFDTAATALLYEPLIYRRVIDLVGADRVLFGSDFPLLGPLRQRRALDAAPLVDAEERRLVAGANSAALFGVS